MTDDEARQRFDQAMSEGRRPAVFLFQPHTFSPVLPDSLADWERVTAEAFGLKSARFDEQLVMESGSWSNSGPDGQICADDSDSFDDDPGFGELGERGGSIASSDLERQPAVFMLQPISYSYVPSDRLGEWERIMRDHVGLPSLLFWENDGSGSLSATLPKDCIDDSDIWAE